jgi:hypothetical protein
MLKNIMAIAIRLHVEVQHHQLADKDVASYVYELDKLTDAEQWVAPLNPLIGPAGGRQAKRRRTAKMRMFCITKDDGSSIQVQTGSL